MKVAIYNAYSKYGVEIEDEREKSRIKRACRNAVNEILKEYGGISNAPDEAYVRTLKYRIRMAFVDDWQYPKAYVMIEDNEGNRYVCNYHLKSMYQGTYLNCWRMPEGRE